MKNVSMIITDYEIGRPIGPMQSSYLYAKGLCEAGCVKRLHIITSGKSNEDELLRAEFSFCDDVEIWPFRSGSVVLRYLFNRCLRDKIRAVYSSSDVVVVSWYPGLGFGLSKKRLRKTIVIMMDSQVRLIKSTIRNLSILQKIVSFFRIIIYFLLEEKINKFSYAAGYVSYEEASRASKEGKKNILHVKLPIRLEEFSKFRVNKKYLSNSDILIPRPDNYLLNIFLCKYDQYCKFHQIQPAKIKVLGGADFVAPTSLAVIHTKFIENYLDFFSLDGRVLLLDRGGAGTTNRLLTICSLGLPFAGTTSAIRGHSYVFPNLLKISDDIDDLIKTLTKDVHLEPEFMVNMRKYYIESFDYQAAVKPLTVLINSHGDA